MQQFDGTSKLLDARIGLWIVATGLPTSNVPVKGNWGALPDLDNLRIRTCCGLWRTILGSPEHVW
jgi:hypothetical protein